MKSKSRLILGLSLGALLTAGLGTAYAFGGGCDGGYGHGMGPRGGAMSAVYRVDDLTAEQRRQLDALRDEMRDKMRKQMDQTRADRDALRDAMARGADPETLRPLAEKQASHMVGMVMQQAEARAALDRILTEAQRKQLEDFADEFGPRGAGRRGPGMGW